MDTGRAPSANHQLFAELTDRRQGELMKTILVGGLLLVALAQQAEAQQKLKQTKIRGYVTEVTSPTTFEIEDYRITRDAGFVLDFENVSPDITFNPNDIRIGVELEIKGLLNEETGELKAQAIKVDLEQFRSIKQTAFVTRPPEALVRLDETWSGQIAADGQRIVVTPQTVVVFKPTSRERKLAKESKKDDLDENEFEPLASLDQVTIGMAMTYEGRRDRDTGAIMAERVEFSHNDLEDGEAKLWRSIKLSVKPAQALKPGELKIDQVGKFKLLPDDSVQEYVTNIGNSLIPSYQMELPQDDPRKIPFRFFVVLDDQANAFALPNGIVVINSGLFVLLENEAQLAAIVGHEIAHATHEHTWRQMQYHKKKRFAIALASAVAAGFGQYNLADLLTTVNGAIQNGHQRQLENQSDRVGLEYMVAAGYDPREAPTVWKLMAKEYGVHATDFFWSSHENQATRRSYLMNELKNNYRNLTYSELRTSREPFQAMKQAVEQASRNKPRVKVR
jgi:Zn-dependent protease with chaperone function